MLLWNILRRGMALMTGSERRRGLFIAAATLVVAFLDIAVLLSSMPFIALLVDPARVTSHPSVARFYALAGQPSPDHFVEIVGFGCIALVLAAGALSLFVQRAASRWMASCEARLARDLLDRTIHAPYSWFLGINAASVVHMIQRDVMQWGRDFVGRIVATLRDVLGVVLPSILLVSATPTSGVFAIAGAAALLMFVTRFMRPRFEMLARISRDADAKAHGYANQSLVGIKDIKISGRESFFVEQFSKAYRTYVWAAAARAEQQRLPVAAVLVLAQVSLFAIALLLWRIQPDRTVLVAQLGLLVLVTSRVVPAANRLAGSYAPLLAVMPVIDSIHRLMSETQAEPGAGAGVGHKLARPWQTIAFDHVAFAYKIANRPALSDICLEIEFGGRYGIVGPSGAGKSTFADILMGFITPTSGRVLIDGVAADPQRWRALRSQIRYVPQAPFIVDDTVRANIAFGIVGSAADDDRVRRTLDAASLQDVIESRSEGLDLQLGDRGLRLSGGQRQRIAIARALYDDCRLLVLDEATSALDTVSERSVQDAILRLSGEVTTVTIAHRLNTVRDCDRIFVFDEGRVVAAGTWAELAATSAVFRRMLDAMGGERAAVTSHAPAG